jgi:hypothetical protein
MDARGAFSDFPGIDHQFDEFIETAVYLGEILVPLFGQRAILSLERFRKISHEDAMRSHECSP